MNCKETRLYLTAHLDDELDVARDAAVVAHLDGCLACADAALAHAARRGLIRDRLPRFNAPDDLRRQVQSTMPTLPGPAKIGGRLMRPLAMAASLALVGLAGYQWGAWRARAGNLEDELASSHARALMTGHVADVVSTDRHTVKPWFAGRLDFAPPVVDLAAEGFPLTGGRVDRIGGRTVAVLIYQRRQHTIEVYYWPSANGAGTGETNRVGFNLLAWDQSGFHGVAVSDLALNEMVDFRRLLQAAK